MSDRVALYFGYGSGGHFLRGGGKRDSLDPRADYPGFPWSISNLDTGLLTNGEVPDQPDGRVFWTCGGVPPNFWFAFYWWDRSGDRRGASNSGFYVRGFEPSRDQAQPAFDFACAAWPKVVARQHHPLRLVFR